MAAAGGQEGERRRGETGFFSRDLGGPVYVSEKQEVTPGKLVTSADFGV